jgi:cytidine deaminase
MSTVVAISQDLKVKLRELALKARDQSYSPYSKFRVGAAILSDDNECILGANIENASYGATICAERTAAVTAVFSGKKAFKAVAIASDLNEGCSPCGICRQL